MKVAGTLVGTPEAWLVRHRHRDGVFLIIADGEVGLTARYTAVDRQRLCDAQTRAGAGYPQWRRRRVAPDCRTCGVRIEVVIHDLSAVGHLALGNGGAARCAGVETDRVGRILGAIHGKGRRRVDLTAKRVDRSEAEVGSGYIALRRDGGGG